MMKRDVVVLIPMIEILIHDGNIPYNHALL